MKLGNYTRDDVVLSYWLITGLYVVTLHTVSRLLTDAMASFRFVIVSFQLHFVCVCVCVCFVYIRFVTLNRRHKLFLSLLSNPSSYSYFLILRRSDKPGKSYLTGKHR